MTHTEYMRKWRAENREKCNAVVRRWRAANPEYVAAQNRAWKEANAEKMRAYRARWNKAHRAERRAHHALRHALDAGRISKPMTCDACGEPGRIEAHHADYSRPLSVAWMCSKCHRAAHAKP